MATIRKEIFTRASPQDAWDAIRDVGALHRRLVPGFVKDTHLEGTVRVVTFGNGKVAREPIVSIEDDQRRLVWGSVGSALTHYSASVQVFPSDGGGSRILWLADLLPNEAEAVVRAMIEQGGEVMKKTLDSLAASD